MSYYEVYIKTKKDVWYWKGFRTAANRDRWIAKHKDDPRFTIMGTCDPEKKRGC